MSPTTLQAPTAAERRTLADDARRAANARADEATKQRAAAERAIEGSDPVARLAALRDLPRDRAAEAEALQQAAVAAKAFETETVAWRAERFTHYRPAAVEVIRAAVEAVEQANRAIDDVRQMFEAAAADGVPLSQWPTDCALFPLAFGPTTQSVFGVVGAPNYVSNCIERLKKGGWLAP